MTLLIFSVTLFLIACIAGMLGALTGLGGGILLIPVLVLLFHIDIHYAMGTSLISVIATSSGSSIAYLREGYTNLRIAMFLEIGAVIGAFIGALSISIFPTNIIAIIFGFVLIFSAYLSLRNKMELEQNTLSHPWAIKLKLDGTYPTPEGNKSYKVQNVPLALGIMTVAGTLSGLLGIGSGALKVLAMDQAMRLPYKVATTTSNFIIGITAAVSAGTYFAYGYIDPNLTFPVMIGVLLGSLIGAKILPKINNHNLRIIFSIMILLLAAQMIYKGFIGKI
jgi:uncharacterized membrane protein YfcA